MPRYNLYLQCDYDYVTTTTVIMPAGCHAVIVCLWFYMLV